MAYPKLREDKNLFVFDGKKIDDPYQWIRDKKNKELKAWVKEENAYTEDFFKKHKDVYKKYYDFNKNKEAHPSYSSVSKSDNGYILTKTLEGIYEVIEVDKRICEEIVLNWQEVERQPAEPAEHKTDEWTRDRHEELLPPSARHRKHRGAPADHREVDVMRLTAKEAPRQRMSIFMRDD